MVAGEKAEAYAVIFGVISLPLQVYVPYRKYIHYLKWLTLGAISYVVTAFVVHVPWGQALRATVVPSVSLDANYLMH